MITSASVLVLNASYEPLHVCNVRRAVTMLIKGVAVCEEEAGEVLHSATVELPLPDVIRLKSYVKIPRRKRSFSRKHVFLRDQHICQYCARLFPVSELTVDHVVPRSRGGVYSWENIVTACKSCNTAKGDRTPEEAYMPLLNEPKSPSVLHMHLQNVRAAGGKRDSWKKYLFY